MISTTSSVAIENNEKDNSTLTAGFAALAFGDQILHPETILNGNSTPNDLSSRSSTSTEENHTLSPFIDPGSRRKKRKQVNETKFHDFISSASAPLGTTSPLSQVMKKLIPERTACRLGCKGANCIYERSDYWRPEQMAINGIFSHWITEDILACSRPTVRHADLKKLFFDAGIRAIFNLEKPDEHVFCGHGNHSSGFSYDPSDFMDVGIFVYNYAMEDYGTVNVETILDIMKVMSFAMTQGKIAVHCHAGLGRTGFIICSYLVYEYRMGAYDSVHYIREKRPGSVQMTRQIEVVKEYERFLIPKRRVFTDCGDSNNKFSLDEHLKNQQAFIHGRDAYIYRYIPRVIFVCAARLIELCTGHMIDTILVTINRRVNVKSVSAQENFENLTEEEKSKLLNFVPSFFHEYERLSPKDCSAYKQIINFMIMSIRDDFLTSEQQEKIFSWKKIINEKNNGIDEVFEETDPCVISGILWNWLRLLKYPVITQEDFYLFTKTDVEEPLVILSKLNKFQRGTIELLAKMFGYIRRFTIDHEDQLLVYCIIHLLTHRPLDDTTQLKESTRNYDKLRLFLISEQANYQNKSQQSVIKHMVDNACLNHELLKHFEIFFIGVSDQFQEG